MVFKVKRYAYKVDNLEEENKIENTEEPAEEPEVDLIDEEGHKEKLEAYEAKEEPTKEEKIIKAKVEESREVAPKEKLTKRLLNFYDKEYKKLMIIPILMLLASIIIIGVQIAKTGSFIYKDVSLKGGVTLTITNEITVSLVELEKSLNSEFKGKEISVNSIKKGGGQIGAIITADIEGTNKEELDSFIKAVESNIGYELKEGEYSVEIMGSSLGASFFREIFTAMVFAFVLMSIIVMVYFRAFIPSIGVVLCAFSDIIETVAVVNLMGMRVGSGGIAAFLMLIGYSVDENMLLTTRVLRRKEGTIFERVLGAVKTGMMMTVTTLAALLVGIILTESDVIRQIMIIVFIGLLIDLINTWIQNVVILRNYAEKKARKD